MAGLPSTGEKLGYVKREGGGGEGGDARTAQTADVGFDFEGLVQDVVLELSHEGVAPQLKRLKREAAAVRAKLIRQAFVEKARAKSNVTSDFLQVKKGRRRKEGKKEGRKEGRRRMKEDERRMERKEDGTEGGWTERRRTERKDGTREEREDG